MIKKLSVIFFTLILILSFFPSSARADGITVTANPADASVTEGSDAVFSASVEAAGEMIPVYTWHLIYNEEDYSLSPESTEALKDVLSGVSLRDDGQTLVLEEVLLLLSGSSVYCSVSAEGIETPVITESAYITVNELTAPSLTVPAKISCYKNDPVRINCTAETSDEDLLSRISYYWYASASSDIRDIDRTLLGTGSFYEPDTSVPGTYYYCCAIAVDAGTNHEKHALSALVTVVVDEELTPPELTLSSDSVTRINAPVTLKLTAVLPESLLYTEEDMTVSWYSCSDAEGAGAVLIPDASGYIYNPPVTSAGTFFYFSNVTVNSEGRSVYANSNTVAVKVYEPVAAVSYNIPGATLTDGAFTDLVASYTFPNASDEGVLTFQWFRSNVSDSYDCSPIPDENSNTLRVKNNGESGTYYYFCEITNEPYVIGTTDKIEGTWYSSYNESTVYVPITFESAGGTTPEPSEKETEAITESPEEPETEPAKESSFESAADKSEEETDESGKESTDEPTEETTEEATVKTEEESEDKDKTEKETAGQTDKQSGEIDLTEKETDGSTEKRPGTNVLSFETSTPIKLAILAVVIVVLGFCIAYLLKRK